MSLINIDLSDTIESWRNKTNQLAVTVGDLVLLNDSSVSLVASINDLQDGYDSDILSLRADLYGDSGATIFSLSRLTTTNKSSIISAINELDRRSIDVYNSTGILLNT